MASLGRIYCIGGYNGNFIATNRVERYTVESHTWEEVASMLMPRWEASGVECNNQIIVAGGENHIDNGLSSVEVYNPDLDQWTSLNPMNSVRVSFRCHYVDGQIYAIAGDRAGKTVERYDVRDNQWKNVDLPGREMFLFESVVVRMARSVD